MRPSSIATILDSVRALGSGIRVHGATASAQALLAARYAKTGNGSAVSTLCVLCPTDDLAADFASDLESLALAVDRTQLKIRLLPTWEQSPYSPVSPSIRTRLVRIATLSSLCSPSDSEKPDILVCSLPAACQATLPRETLLAHSLTLKSGGEIPSREFLIRHLLEAGYLRVDPVEDQGTFAVRGDIVDVFPPNLERPVRIELFDTSIERIREFDPSTQRALASSALDEVHVSPAREILIGPATVARLREKLKARADDVGIPKGRRDPVLASVQDGNYAGHSDAWAPFAYDRVANLWDYLSAGPAAATVVWVDELTTLQEWDLFLTEQKKLADDAISTAVIAPAVEELFAWDSSSEKKLREKVSVYLDRLELAELESVGKEPEEAAAPEAGAPPAPSKKHRAAVRPNGDLAAGTRHSIRDLEPKLRLWLKQGFRVVALASTRSQLERMRYLLEENTLACQQEAAPAPSIITLCLGTLTEGFRWPAEGLVVLTEGELLGARHARSRRRGAERGSAAQDWAGLQALSDLGVGDAVVHVDHGIGRYQGLVRLDISGAPNDFLLLEYADRDRLYLPVYRLNVIQKYAGSGDSAPLDRLGSQQFARTKEKVREAVKHLAVDLVRIYAERKITEGVRFSPRDALFREFESRFPFDETPDQLKAIDDSLSDMESGRSMDRLVCGDVGYGKTEVAIRCAFRAVSDGKQVAVLVPTTVLAFQHEQSFRTRMKDYPISIDSLSRFKSAKEQKTVVEGLASGKTDIVIGTHRLLSADIRFNDLGLVIVDEEHRFGVEHKEKLKALKINTHVLTLTATPIPRTLHMALSGIRDISLINTAPVDRLPIRTYVSKLDESLVQRAIRFELGRGGLVFYMHNRVQSIHETAARVAALVPEATVAIGHGQMAEGALEKVMLSFYEKRANVLVCTTIIESGLDVPSANTILIERADSLGLAQLYQIRGRVGRSQQRAYAYLLLPAEGTITGDAKKRLEVIQRFVELGSGFSIASHDLEIRGGGDLLGPQQSGHIAAVGFDLYTELLEEAIREIKKEPETPESSAREPEIKAPFPAFLGEEYVPDIHQRLSLYRRFSASRSEEEITRLEEELGDRFGPLPAEAQNLLWLIRIKLLLKSAGVDSLTVGPEKVALIPGPASRLDPVRTIALLSSDPARYQLTPDSKLVAKVPTATLRDLFFGLENLVQQFSSPRNGK